MTNQELFLRAQEGLSYQDFCDLLPIHIEQFDESAATPLELAHHESRKLSVARMKRVEKTFQPKSYSLSILESIAEPQHWFVLSEDWCGDTAQCLPVMMILAEESPKISLTIIERDKNDDIMQMFLTDETRSIPKLVALSESGEVLLTWGSRPIHAQKLVDAARAEGKTKAEWHIDLHKWYAQDKGQEVEQELIAELSKVLKSNVQFA